jgi:hypothetical protein
MAPMVLMTALVLSLPVLAQNGAGRLRIYGDVQNLYCSLADEHPGILTVHILHEFSAGGATGSSFRVVTGAGFTGTYLSEGTTFVPLGDLRTGVHLGYGVCLTSMTEVAMISFTTFGTSSQCSYIAIVAHPDALSGQIEATDCSLVTHSTLESEFRAFVNSNASCEPWCILAIGPSTWGHVKALYR